MCTTSRGQSLSVRVPFIDGSRPFLEEHDPHGCRRGPLTILGPVWTPAGSGHLSEVVYTESPTSPESPSSYSVGRRYGRIDASLTKTNSDLSVEDSSGASFTGTWPDVVCTGNPERVSVARSFVKEGRSIRQKDSPQDEWCERENC